MKWVAHLIQDMFALRKTKTYDILLSIMLAVIVGAVATELVNLLIGWYPEAIPEGLQSVNESIRQSEGPTLATFLVAVCVIAPVFEELVFRGILCQLD